MIQRPLDFFMRYVSAWISGALISLPAFMHANAWVIALCALAALCLSYAAGWWRGWDRGAEFASGHLLEKFNIKHSEAQS